MNLEETGDEDGRLILMLKFRFSYHNATCFVWYNWVSTSIGRRINYNDLHFFLIKEPAIIVMWAVIA